MRTAALVVLSLLLASCASWTAERVEGCEFKCETCGKVEMKCMNERGVKREMKENANGS